MKKIRFLLILALLAKSISGFGQLDTEFWFAIPYISTALTNTEYRLVFTTTDQASSVTLSFPALSAVSTQSPMNIAANSSFSYTLNPTDLSFGRHLASDTSLRTNKGIKITATNPIYCYFEISEPVLTDYSTDIFSLKGKNALGKEFLVPFQNYLDNSNTVSPQARSYLYIVATEASTITDPTNITITLPAGKTISGYSGSTIYVGLSSEGQVFPIKIPSYTGADRPAGMVITSNKKVAVILCDNALKGDPWNSAPPSPIDLSGDQLIPVELFGTKFIAVESHFRDNNPFIATYPTSITSSTTFDPVFILASKDATTVSVNGTYKTTLNRGQVWRYDFTPVSVTGSGAGTVVVREGACFIETNHDVCAYQLSGIGAKTGYAILPPIECRGSQSVSAKRPFTSTSELWLILITKQEYVNGFTYTPSTVTVSPTTDFKNVPGTTEWKYCLKGISRTALLPNAELRVENSLGKFHMGFISGLGGQHCKFAYLSDFSKTLEIAKVTGKDRICQCDTLNLQCNELNTNYLWKGPNGATWSTQTICISNVQLGDSGWYKVTGKDCPIRPDSVYVLINPVDSIKLYDTVCLNNAYAKY